MSNTPAENPASIPVFIATTTPVQFERYPDGFCFSTTDNLPPVSILSQATSLLEGMQCIIANKDPDSYSPSDYLFISVLEMVGALLKSVVITIEG